MGNNKQMIYYKWSKGGSFVALPTDFSKPFICFSHDLFNAKLHVYGFDMALVKLIFTYVYGRKQRVKKKEDKYSKWEEILFSVLQVFIPGFST